MIAITYNRKHTGGLSIITRIQDLTGISHKSLEKRVRGNIWNINTIKDFSMDKEILSYMGKMYTDKDMKK